MMDGRGRLKSSVRHFLFHEAGSILVKPQQEQGFLVDDNQEERGYLESSFFLDSPCISISAH